MTCSKWRWSIFKPPPTVSFRLQSMTFVAYVASFSATSTSLVLNFVQKAFANMAAFPLEGESMLGRPRASKQRLGADGLSGKLRYIDFSGQFTNM